MLIYSDEQLNLPNEKIILHNNIEKQIFSKNFEDCYQLKENEIYKIEDKHKK